ncbi:hypothetical protein SB861_67910, partial [Paraburkholderia sp. SIMBA_049]
MQSVQLNSQRPRFVVVGGRILARGVPADETRFSCVRSGCTPRTELPNLLILLHFNPGLPYTESVD